MPRMIPVFGPLDRNAPSALFKYMVKPIAPYGVSGVIWYQGESDTAHADVYDQTMAAVIDSWRGLWQEDLPFLMVQLAPYEGLPGFPPAINYGPLRAQQDKVTRDRPLVYVTNVMDAGMRQDIHPKQKKEVGERLALLARGKVYQEPIVCEAPQVSACEKRDSKIIISLDNCGDGLQRMKPDIGALEVVAAGEHLRGCRVSVLKNQLLIRAKTLRTAGDITVRYGMRNYCQCNIKNSAGIPVKPFTISMQG
jgi:sialate O-acetylesterase